MDFFILLIIWLLIIVVTYFSKIQKKQWLLYFFWIYLVFLLYIWLFEKSWNSSFILESSDIGILTIFFGMFFFIFYILLYFFIFPFQDKQLTLKKKWYLLLRDSVILYWIFMFFFLYNTIAWIYSNYYQWYKNPDNFHSEIYKCEETNTKLLLEYNYQHGTILNPYKNFLEFYNNYGEIWEDGKILINQLQKELVTEQFLTTCINKKWENYYNKYLKIHGMQPYYDENINRINLKYKKYFISDSELKEILNKLKNK